MHLSCVGFRKYPKMPQRDLQEAGFLEGGFLEDSMFWRTEFLGLISWRKDAL